MARQPIFDKNKKIYAYELLFRGGMTNAFPKIDGDVATSKLLTNTFFSIGIDSLLAGKKGFINFTKPLLINKTPLMFPKENIVIEILEDVEPDKDVVQSCVTFFKQGYILAMDDFIFKPGLAPLLSIAHIIKFDFRLSSIQEIKSMLRKLSNYKLKYLAEKIETYDEFNKALELGFTYFQGYFFSKPEILKGRDIAPSKINFLQILSEVNQKNVNFAKLESIINRDISISYKLLKYINSAFFRRLTPINSIKEAIVLLGEKGIKQFISLIATAQLASDKPDELIRSSIIRAKSCELFGGLSSDSLDKSELFIVGLFSHLDAMLDNTMDNIIKDLPLSESVKLALGSNEGRLSDYLCLSIAYEQGDWKTCQQLITKLKLNEMDIPKCFIESVNWAEAYTKI